jgi:hypothetical protein
MALGGGADYGTSKIIERGGRAVGRTVSAGFLIGHWGQVVLRTQTQGSGDVKAAMKLLGFAHPQAWATWVVSWQSVRRTSA